MLHLPLTIDDIPENVLRIFICNCIERLLSLERTGGRELDWELKQALVVYRRWLDGQATEEEIAAARAAARSAVVRTAWQSFVSGLPDETWMAAELIACAICEDIKTTAKRFIAWAMAQEGESSWQSWHLSRLLKEPSRCTS